MNAGIRASNPSKLRCRTIPVKGIQMPIVRAISHGLFDEKYPQMIAANKIMNAVIPASSQFGLESIHVISSPRAIAIIRKMMNVFFICSNLNPENYCIISLIVHIIKP